MKEQTKADREANPVDRLVMIEPFIEPEHKELIDKAESQLKEYESILLESLKNAFAIEPHPEDVRKAQREFMNDPFRRQMVKLICDMKMIFEKPRFIVHGS